MHGGEKCDLQVDLNVLGHKKVAFILKQTRINAPRGVSYLISLFRPQLTLVSNVPDVPPDETIVGTYSHMHKQ